MGSLPFQGSEADGVASFPRKRGDDSPTGETAESGGGRGSSPGDDPPFWVAGPGLNVQMIYIFFNSAWQFNYIINHFIVNNI